MAERIGLLVEKVLSDSELKCSRCLKRQVYKDKKWCKRCQQWYFRYQNRGFMGENTTKELKSLLGERYWQAKIYHLNTNLKKIFQQLPDEQGVMLWGDIGCGKTYAMSALARRYYVQGWDVIFIRWYELMLQIRKAFSNNTAELLAIKPFCEVDKLFIDDLGVTVSRNSQESEHSTRTFELILDKRLANYLPTLITSNRSIEDLATNFDQRIASRIQQGCIIIQTIGKDKRIT